MKEGDMVWFDAFYHRQAVGKAYARSVEEYAIPAIIVKYYTDKERRKIFSAGGDYDRHGKIYDVLIKGKVHIAPEETLLPMTRGKEFV